MSVGSVSVRDAVERIQPIMPFVVISMTAGDFAARSGARRSPIWAPKINWFEVTTMIETVTLMAFIPAALALNFTPGADMMFCFGQGLRSGSRPALMASAGISTGSDGACSAGRAGTWARGGISRAVAVRCYPLDGCRVSAVPGVGRNPKRAVSADAANKPTRLSRFGTG